MKFSGTHKISDFVAAFIKHHQAEIRSKTVVDLPAGEGVSSGLLRDAGAEVHAYDLFPAVFKAQGVECQKADLMSALPIGDGFADMVLCQEGIEHLPNQHLALKELSRILKPGGRLILTTPNYSNMRSRFSYLFSESEMYKLMPPNEIDSVWFSDPRSGSSQIYFGHVFSIGIQRLRLLALLAGLKIRKIHHHRANNTSVVLLLLTYPFVFWVNYAAYRRAMRKRKDIEYENRKRIFGEVFRLGIDPRILVEADLFVEFEKVTDADAALKEIQYFHKLGVSSAND
ncbi:hypothetical protein Tel_02895 [Candidatus Tenderia electrophaga]|jgi:SAM-dependent methyltransferase|uniref:Methyltransferase type 11 domain-containing protein n=1 Tax=Candidatus Tenderia electrophaga TaxID=1748243 RepID=A0A0S2TAJ7_9GAMM|nr:hypothetical protein Tel_02895 [Candidatus Tenderia electrophaga]